MHIGERIKQKRLELGITQTELAKRMGYTSKTSICKVETGQENLTTDRVTKFAEALNTTESYLMGWEDQVPRTVETGKMLGKLLKNPKLYSYIETISNLSAEKQELLFAYIDILNSSNH